MNKANLFIVGAAKCGTTSLYEYLAQHPEVYMSPVKEPHFFATNVSNANKELFEAPEQGKKYHTKIIRDTGVYASLFEDGQDHKIRGEASPSYLWDEDAAQKIYEYNKEAKIIVLLRDPVKRLISQFQMAVALGTHQQELFLPFIKKEYEKEKKVWGIDHIYIDLGFYFKQISRYTQLFPASQIMIIKLDDLIQNKKETLRNIFRFLQIDESKAESINAEEVHNTTAHPKYSFIKKLRKNKLVKAFTRHLGNTKETLKKILYKQGYDKKVLIDEEAIDFLKTTYKEDLQQLKNSYHIEF